jgi:hypothetical protein
MRVSPLVGGSLALGGDGDHPSVGPERPPGALLRVTGDRVEDDVHVPEVLFEADDAAVENVVGTSLRDEREISSGGGRRHLGANEAGQLYRKDAHAACPAVHQPPFCCAKPRAIEQPPPRRQGSYGNRGRLDAHRSARLPGNTVLGGLVTLLAG